MALLLWILIFLAIAIIASLLGLKYISGLAKDIAKILFFVFLVLFVVSLIFYLF